MDRSNIWRGMESLCEAAWVDPQKVFPHNLRHLFAVLFYRSEKDIAKLADLLGHASISNYKRSLRAAFFIAIEDDCIRRNPFSFALSKVLDDNRGEKTVLTPEQEVSLIDFAQNDPVYQKYTDELIILLGSGC